jgi:pimeloyl-ACP methyl ester carboxylesterase
MYLLRTFGLLTRLTLLALLLPAVPSAAQPPGIPDGWSDGYVYANGIRIHYYRATTAPGKPVIVMVHGVTDIGLSWTTLTSKLQGAYDIYMLDARAHGLTDPFTAADTGDTLVKDVVEFVRTMKLEKPILMGHSMGAATVRRVGAEFPELAKAIVMLDPGLGPGGPGTRPAAAAATGAGAAGPPSAPASPPTGAPATAASPDPLPVSMRGTPEALIAQNNYQFDDLVAKCRRQSPKWDLVDCQYWALSKKQYHGAYSDQAWQAMSGSMRAGDSLAKIPVPALILKADAPPDVRKTHQEAAAVMQKGTLVHIDGAGHNLHHDQLARTVEVLTKFLSAL